MGDGADDADCSAESREAAHGLRELFNRATSTEDVVWVDKRGNKTKIKDFNERRLKAIRGYLISNITKNDNKDWLVLIEHEIVGRSKKD